MGPDGDSIKEPYLGAGDVVEVEMTVSAGSGKCSGRPEVGGFDWIRALVTGGASGIGLAAAQGLAREGATVAVLDRARQGPDDFAGSTTGTWLAVDGGMAGLRLRPRS